jgi:hypothetical protein
MPYNPFFQLNPYSGRVWVSLENLNAGFASSPVTGEAIPVDYGLARVVSPGEAQETYAADTAGRLSGSACAPG